MRRLHIDQPVTLSLDEVIDAVPCRVLDVQGSVGRLVSSDELAPHVVGRLALGSAGYLVFQALRAAVGLRVAVRASPPHLEVAVIDGIALPERRGSERVQLHTPARIIAAAGAEPGATNAAARPADDEAWTQTVNLSERGALLRVHPALMGQRHFGLELMFGDDPQPVTAQATVARRTQQSVGVAFDTLADADATRLREYLMGVRHQRR
jgi:hypothetical protein